MMLNMTAGGSRTFALSMMANGNANIIEFDDSTGGFVNGSSRNSGVLLKQTTSAFSTASITGGYAFGFVGIDSGKNRFGVAGNVQADGLGHLCPTQQVNCLLDSDDSLSGPSSGVSITAGAYSVASSGRGTATITTAQGTATYALYVVNSTELLVVGIDPFAPGGNPLVSGTFLQQSNNGSFSNTSFNGPSVFEVTALDASTPESQVGVFNASSGNLNLTSDQNSGGTLTSPCSGTPTQCGPGSYSVASNGRVTLADSGFQNSQTPQNLQPVLYLVTNNQAFIIGTDPAVSFGFMTPQSGSPFSLSGTYAGGSLAPVDPGVSNVVSIAVAGSGALTVTQNVSNAGGLSHGQAVGTTTLTDASTGRFVATLGSATEILYLVSTGQYFALSAVPNDPDVRVEIFGQ
jgi:hypothetical protein